MLVKGLQEISDRFDVFQAIRGQGLLIGCVVTPIGLVGLVNS